MVSQGNVQKIFCNKTLHFSSILFLFFFISVKSKISPLTQQLPSVNNLFQAWDQPPLSVYALLRPNKLNPSCHWWDGRLSFRQYLNSVKHVNSLLLCYTYFHMFGALFLLGMSAQMNQVLKLENVALCRVREAFSNKF